MFSLANIYDHYVAIICLHVSGIHYFIDCNLFFADGYYIFINLWRNSAFFLLESLTVELFESWILLSVFFDSPVMYIRLIMSLLCTLTKSSFGRLIAKSFSFLQTVIFLLEDKYTVEYDPSDLMCTIS